MNTRKRILVLHGYFGTQDSFFLPYLREHFTKLGHEAFCPSLPQSDKPKLVSWISAVQDWCALGPVDLAVSHSLGGTLAMNLVSQDLIELQALVVIGSSFGPKDEPNLNTFLNPSIDLNKLKKIRHRIAICSYDDPWTHHEYSTLFIKQCNAIGLFYSDKGHFETNLLPAEAMAIIASCLDNTEI